MKLKGQESEDDKRARKKRQTEAPFLILEWLYNNMVISEYLV